MSGGWKTVRGRDDPKPRRGKPQASWKADREGGLAADMGDDVFPSNLDMATFHGAATSFAALSEKKDREKQERSAEKEAARLRQEERERQQAQLAEERRRKKELDDRRRLAKDPNARPSLVSALANRSKVIVAALEDLFDDAVATSSAGTRLQYVAATVERFVQPCKATDGDHDDQADDATLLERVYQHCCVEIRDISASTTRPVCAVMLAIAKHVRGDHAVTVTSGDAMLALYGSYGSAGSRNLQDDERARGHGLGARLVVQLLVSPASHITSTAIAASVHATFIASPALTSASATAANGAEVVAAMGVPPPAGLFSGAADGSGIGRCRLDAVVALLNLIGSVEGPSRDALRRGDGKLFWETLGGLLSRLCRDAGCTQALQAFKSTTSPTDKSGAAAAERAVLLTASGVDVIVEAFGPVDRIAGVAHVVTLLGPAFHPSAAKMLLPYLLKRSRTSLSYAGAFAASATADSIASLIPATGLSTGQVESVQAIVKASSLVTQDPANVISVSPALTNLLCASLHNAGALTADVAAAAAKSKSHFKAARRGARGSVDGSTSRLPLLFWVGLCFAASVGFAVGYGCLLLGQSRLLWRELIPYVGSESRAFQVQKVCRSLVTSLFPAAPPL